MRQFWIADCGLRISRTLNYTAMMKISVAVLVCLSLVLSGCETTPAANSATGAYTVQNIKSGGAGSDGEAPVRIKLSSAGNMSEADLSSIVAYVKIVAKREATRQQAMVAQQRAQAIAAKMSPAVRAKTRYIAVETVRSAASFQTQPAVFVEGRPALAGPAPKFERSVMIWDTARQALVGNAVYDISSTPAVGTSARFETYTARYVGGGG